MSTDVREAQPEDHRTSAPILHHALVTVESHRHLAWIDLTPSISRLVGACGLARGVVAVQTRHTTTGLLINEYEPLLLGDLEAMFDRVAATSAEYAHDDMSRRMVNRTAHERRNGHAHCRAALLRSSEQVHVSDGVVMLGRWQRVLFVDFDGPQRRQLSLLLSGVGETGSPSRSTAARRPPSSPYSPARARPMS